ncbi:MAG: glycosyltransferase family 4 protein [Vicinamibacteria bacterium]|nr:glycosyltransferase family 4 protein [Vicinamibacteria bacterium]
MKLACVVQRYGADIAGGAEYHCRLIAEHLRAHAEVEVFTTCAHDYITWANHYKPGRDEVNGVPVHRFRVKRPRDERRFAAWSDVVFSLEHTRKDELRWLEEEGPFAPELVRRVRQARDQYDAWLFFSYRYYTAYHGALAAPERAILVPTAENDGIYNLRIFPPLFRAARAIVYNSPEERALIESAAGTTQILGDVVGVGIAPPARVDPEGFRRRHGIEGPFALYVGRIDRNKGCRELFAYFRRFRAERASALRLALIGKAVLPVPDDPAFISLGFQPEQEKWDALAAADLLIMPSPYESLSMVTLEAWWAERPVLVNAKCEVLRGQCLRAQGGLYFASEDEFCEALAVLCERTELHRAMGANGKRYVEANYAWPVIERKYMALLDEYLRRRGRA